MKNTDKNKNKSYDKNLWNKKQNQYELGKVKGEFYSKIFLLTECEFI